MPCRFFNKTQIFFKNLFNIPDLYCWYKRKGDLKNERINKSVENIAESIVSGYKRIEDGAVKTYKKIKNGVVKEFAKVIDRCIEVLFTKEN